MKGLFLILFFCHYFIKTSFSLPSCPDGYYYQWPQCWPCPAITACPSGYYSDGCSASFGGVCKKCDACATNQFRAGCGDASAGACYQCRGVVSSDFVFPCPPGTYSNATGNSRLSDCHPCEAGKYSDQGGQLACKTCQTATIAPYAGFSTCYDCPPGFKGIVGNYLTCQMCGVGEYQDESRQTTCKQCPAPRTSRPNTTAIDGCVCSSGYYEVDGQCQACPENFVCPISFV